MLQFFLIVVLILNIAWFGVAFHYFSLKQFSAAKVLVPSSSRESPLFKTVAASVRFLGGMNLAFALLSTLFLLNLDVFPSSTQRCLLLLVFAVAHGSQFYFNVPIALGGGRQGESLWNVLHGPMRFIFFIDATLMVANGALSAAYLVSHA